MKNIYLLPTDKPSKIGYHFDIVPEGRIDYAPNFGFPLFDKGRNFQHRPHNIYITSDEEIKEGDWVYIDYIKRHPNSTPSMDSNPIKKFKCLIGIEKTLGKFEDGINHYISGCKKIILTTDQDLIKDGVQAIDDEFLEWFVKNPSCEFVEIKVEDMFNETYGEMRGDYYRVVIPQEEPRKYPIGGYAPGNYHCNCVTCKTMFQGDKRAVQCLSCALETAESLGAENVEMKSETLEEVLAQKVQELTNCNLHGLDEQSFKGGYSNGFVNGAKWQAEQEYAKYLSDEAKKWDDAMAELSIYRESRKIKQETLEEVAERLHPDTSTPGYIDQYSEIARKYFIEGAKWQSEIMYSEEDMKLSFEAGKKGYMRGSMLHREYYFTWKNFKQWFEQFKKNKI